MEFEFSGIFTVNRLFHRHIMSDIDQMMSNPTEIWFVSVSWHAEAIDLIGVKRRQKKI